MLGTHQYAVWRQRSRIRSHHLVRPQRRNMHPSSSRRGSAICTGSAEVTEGCHMRIAACATHTLALLQEENRMRFATRQHITSQHQQLERASRSNPVTSFFVNPKDQNTTRRVIVAETLFANMVAEHNLSFSLADHFTKVVKQQSRQRKGVFYG